MASLLRADHCAVWLLALHVAALRIKTFASCLANRWIALGSTCLLALVLNAAPMAHRVTCVITASAELLLLSTILLVGALTLELPLNT